MILRRLLAALCLSGALLSGGTAAAAQEWQEWPLPLPAGGTFQTPPNAPGDLSFQAPNRGLMTVSGNNSVPEGLYSWDGVQWHQLATVCGGGANARIAWAGPDEFWTIARPSLPRDPVPGLALCHFKGGEVVGSFSTVQQSEDRYLPMLAAACDGPNDCWFAGVAGLDGTGTRSGGFHLHWDGSRLQTVYAPQGRAISDLLADGGRFFESTYVGGQPGAAAGSAILREPEAQPRLLHRITGGAFSNDAFVPLTVPGGTELRGLDSAVDGAGQMRRWAVGGGARFEGTTTRRQPLAAQLVGDTWTELKLTSDPALPDDLTFGDVAAIPGTGAAWVTLVDPGAGDGQLSRPTVARIAADGAVRVVELAPSGAPRGAASRVDCPAPDDCWVATARGYLYRLTGAPTYARDTDPAFQGTITVRPNEAAEQFVPDEPPQDDSLLLAPPIELAPEPEAVADTSADTCELPKLISRQRSKVLGKKRLRLVVSFRLARRAGVGLTGRRAGKVVARAPLRTLRAGTRSLTLRITRKKYPKQLRFVIRNDSGAAACSAASRTQTRP